jgi:hypothetical protein
MPGTALSAFFPFSASPPAMKLIAAFDSALSLPVMSMHAERFFSNASYCLCASSMAFFISFSGTPS